MKRYFILLLLFSGCRKIETTYRQTNTVADSKTAIAHKLNIILIIGDDIGYELLTCNGGQSYETPNLDAMAHRGVQFTNCYGSPLCSPSRFTILTGKYNFRNYTQWGYMDPSNKTIGNMMQDAGYSTCYAGKWQLNGFETSVQGFGFDKYSIWEPGKDKDAGSRYKSPHIYQGGGFLPDHMTLNKYADDWFTDYIFNFIDSTPKPYFVYYSMSLCHSAFSPTPDDSAAFARWDPNNDISKPAFFPSMVKYMDKKIGEILDSAGNNTVVIFVGDNGTPTQMTSMWNGIDIQGAKGSTNIYGTHVPLIVYRKGGSSYIDTSLVDFTDFLPTLASIANIPVPKDYGILDGTAFYPQQSAREWIFCHYEPHPDKHDGNLTRWVQNSVYKRYGSQSTIAEKKHRLYNIVSDPYELRPIANSKQTAEEKAIDSSFEVILQNMHN